MDLLGLCELTLGLQLPPFRRWLWWVWGGLTTEPEDMVGDLERWCLFNDDFWTHPVGRTWMNLLTAGSLKRQRRAKAPQTGFVCMFRENSRQGMALGLL